MKIRISRSFIPVILFSCLLASCTKQEDLQYFLKLKINGKDITWRQVQGELGPDQGDVSKTSFILTANNDKQTESFDLAIKIPAPVMGANTYPSDMYFIPISFTKDAGGDIKSYQSGDVAGALDPMYTVELTSITENVIRGRFTGNYLVNPSTNEVLVITEGNFALPRKH